MDGRHTVVYVDLMAKYTPQSVFVVWHELHYDGGGIAGVWASAREAIEHGERLTLIDDSDSIEVLEYNVGYDSFAEDDHSCMNFEDGGFEIVASWAKKDMVYNLSEQQQKKYSDRVALYERLR